MVFIMNKTVLGIDIGGSTTKIVGFDRDGNILEPMSVKAADPVTSFYGAFGTFTSKNSIELGDVGRVMVTGVGASQIKNPVYGLTCESIPEFTCIGRGGLYLSGFERAIVVSMGTGTAIVYAEKDKPSAYLGGTGVGGGTIKGLAKKLLGMDTMQHILELASEGDLGKVDLRVGDIADPEKMPLNSEMTAANFGRMSDIAAPADVALGLVNLVCETVAMCSIFAARKYDCTDIVLTGKLSSGEIPERLFGSLSQMFGVNFFIPHNAGFGTVIGAALEAK